MNHQFHIRPIDPNSEAEATAVAERMRQTLVEVLGEEKGDAMYTMEWLINRVQWHLDAEKITGQVYLAEKVDGAVIGHVIVRVDRDENGQEIGLFATTYIEPEHRRYGIATKLLKQGEQWMVRQGMKTAVTYTDKDNEKLQKLYIGQGYEMMPMPKEFVKLEKSLAQEELVPVS